MMLNNKKQQGFSLFMVMILMIVIALLVMISVQSSTTEMRMSTNEADRKFAVSLAENGLREAETKVRNIALGGTSVITFKSDCTDGYCAAANDGSLKIDNAELFKTDTTNLSKVPAWERCASDGKSACKVGKTVLDDDCEKNKRCFTTNDGKVHYIMEYLGNREIDGDFVTYFRITSRARGNNKDTLVTLQIHVELQG